MDVLFLLSRLLLLVKRSSKLAICTSETTIIRFIILNYNYYNFYSNIYNFDINSRLLIFFSSIANMKSKLYAKITNMRPFVSLIFMLLPSIT